MSPVPVLVDTVTVEVAVAFVPALLVAVAVYVVVTVGLTVTVPPTPESVVLELSTLLVTTTEEAFCAVTLRVELCPEVMEAGLAVMVTVGAEAVELTLTYTDCKKLLPEASQP